MIPSLPMRHPTSGCAYCRTTELICFWGELRPYRAWRRWVLFGCSLIIIAFFAWLLAYFFDHPNAWTLWLIGLPMLLVSILGIVVSLSGCERCVVSSFRRLTFFRHFPLRAKPRLRRLALAAADRLRRFGLEVGRCVGAVHVMAFGLSLAILRRSSGIWNDWSPIAPLQSTSPRTRAQMRLLHSFLVGRAERPNPAFGRNPPFSRVITS